MSKDGRSTNLAEVLSVVFTTIAFQHGITQVLKKYLRNLKLNFLPRWRRGDDQSLGVTKAVAFLLTFCCFTLSALPIFGQSDPGNFTTIINAPDAVIGDRQSIGSNTQLNIFDGANIGPNLGAGESQSTNTEINVFGGVVPDINVDNDNFGVSVNVIGGVVGSAEGTSTRFARFGRRFFGSGIRTEFTSSVNISGGTVQGFSQLQGGNVTISGGEFLGPIDTDFSNVSISGGVFTDFVRFRDPSFSLGAPALTLTASDVRLNGEAFSGNTLPSLSFGDTLSGTFADGSGFIFSREDQDRLPDGVSIQAISLPAPDLQPITISQAADTAPQNLRAGQTLTLSNNGSLGVGFTAVRSTVLIEGGNVGDSFEASEATVTVSGGNIGDRFNAFNGGDVNITGGSFGSDFLAGNDSNVRISGGSFGDRFISQSSSGPTTFVGDEFLLNGVALSDSSSVNFDVSEADVFTATLADGTVSIFASKPEVDDPFPFPPFLLTQSSSDLLMNVNLETSTLPAADLNPIVLDGNSSSQPKGLRSGQSLTVLNGGSVDRNFAAVNATVDIQGGSVGESFEVANADVTVSAGTIGDRFNVFQDSQVTINGGVIGDFFYAGNNSRVAVLDGEIGDEVNIVGGSTIEIDGGVIGQNFGAAEGTIVDVRDGSIGNGAFIGGTLNLSGGTIGSDATFSGDNQVNISGGSVGDGLKVENNVHLVVSGDGVLGNGVLFSGGTLDINGGSVGDGLAVSEFFGFSSIGAVANLFDGSIGDDALVDFDGVLNIHGGSVGERLAVGGFGTINIFGGSIADSFEARSGTVNLFVTEAILDGVALDLFADVPFELGDLTSPLEAILSDGSVFRLDSSNQFAGSTINLFSASAVPEPSTCLLGVALLMVSTCRRRRVGCGVA